MKNIKIDIGCWKHPWPEATHCIDIENYSSFMLEDQIFIKADVTQGIPRIQGIKDGCVVHINMTHFLEHIYYFQTKELLIDIWKLLKESPDGTLAIDLPNISKAFEFADKVFPAIETHSEKCAWGNVMHVIFGKQDDILNSHRYGYNHFTLQNLLKETASILFTQMN